VVLVSATLPNEVLQMTQQFMTDPIKILVKRDELTLEVRGTRCNSYVTVGLNALRERNLSMLGAQGVGFLCSGSSAVQMSAQGYNAGGWDCLIRKVMLCSPRSLRALHLQLTTGCSWFRCVLLCQ
jgi:hypothetical protein